MRLFTFLVPLLLLGVGLVPAQNVHASGTYIGRPANPPGPLDRNLYKLGKTVFAGKAAIGSEAASNAGERVGKLIALLKKRGVKKFAFEGSAAALSAEQLGALEYFAKIRYRVTVK